MTKKHQTAVDIMLMSMQGNVASAVTRRSMEENRIPTQEEFDFLQDFSNKTNREIGEFLFERNFSAGFTLFGYDTK